MAECSTYIAIRISPLMSLTRPPTDPTLKHIAVNNKDFVVPLGSVRTRHLALVGGKAANLGELAASGLPVPPAFVVTTNAYRQFFGTLDLQADIERIDNVAEQELRETSIRIQQHILSATVANDIVAEILVAHASLLGADKQAPIVVRSSATAEDLTQASFAGQHRTYYHVESARLLQVIQQCWASVWTAEAAIYRAAHGISHRFAAMAVIVQRIVRSHVSGVAFTADPMTLDKETIIIESNWGLGASIMDGQATPDRFVVNRATLRVQERRIAQKRMMVSPDTVSSERLVEVSVEKRDVETLSPRQIEAVAVLALRCEHHFESPQDVEWALADGELHLLQSRPLTTVARQPIAAPKGKWVLFKPVVENFTDPLTPLQVDLMTRVFAGFLRPIGGRFYVNIAPVRWLLPLDVSDEAVASLLYLSGDAVPKRVHFRLLKLPVTVIVGAAVWLAAAVMLTRSRGMPDDFMDGYRDLCRRVERDPRIGPIVALRRLLTIGRFGDPVGRLPVPVNFGAAIRASLWVGVVRAMLRRWAPALGSDAVAILCAGSDGVLSVEMGRDLALLGDSARREPAVAALIMTASPEDVLHHLRATPGGDRFAAQLNTFLGKHGHRTVKEFEVQTSRWEENPASVIATVRNYLIGAPTDDRDVAERRVEEARKQLQNRVRESLGWRWPALRFATLRAREFLKLRENSRSYHIMGFGVVRKKILIVEQELLRDEKLKCRGDIFFLLWSEVSALRAGLLEATDIEQRIHARRIEHLRLAKSKPPRTFGIVTTQPPISHAGILTGQGASPGRCEGLVRVILDPSADVNLRPGEVLVAPYADPAWSPLFLTAGAAVVEVGSYLSHAGTVAREYGMPFVVDVTDCTSRLRDGMRVLVDGDRGTVHILEGETA